MAQADEVLRRLREDDEHLASLADLLIDEALARPLRELVNPEFLNAAICKALRTLAEQDELEAWLRDHDEAAVEDLIGAALPKGGTS